MKYPNPAPTLMVSGALSVAVAAFMDRPVMAAVGWLMLLTGALGVCVLQGADKVAQAIRRSQVQLTLRDIQISNVEKGPSLRIEKHDQTREDDQ